jgi:hypothetical protein
MHRTQKQRNEKRKDIKRKDKKRKEKKRLDKNRKEKRHNDVGKNENSYRTAEDMTISSRMLNLSHDSVNKSLTVDLGNVSDLTNVIVKAAHLKTPISVLNSDMTLPTVAESGDGDQITITNTGIINRSQFSDGGFGDIGQQWHRVRLYKSTVTNNHTSINVTLSGKDENVYINRNSFGTGKTISGTNENKD